MPQTGDGQRVDTLTTLLTAITGRRYGLPQQNHPSDVLAEAYIDVLERRLHRANARVWRYSDDFRIATDSWSDALATVDLLEREVRRIGLTLNDSKTVIRRGDTYEASLKRREVLLKQVADEADLDLTGVRLARGYDQGNDDEPEQDPVTSAALRKLVARWAAHDDNTGHANILTQLMPTVLSRLSVDSDADVVLPACMEMLRTDQALTPAVATYLLRATVANESKVLAAFDGLLSRNPYLTPWQAAWLTPVLVRSQSFATAAGGQARSNWLRSVWEDGRAPEPVRAAVASGLARHRLVTADDQLGAYERFSQTSRPALAAAVGLTGLRANSGKARSVTANDQLSALMFTWGKSMA